MLAKQYFENWNTQRSADSDQHNKQAIIIQVLLEKKKPLDENMWSTENNKSI
jgi:hypothetical protein